MTRSRCPLAVLAFALLVPSQAAQSQVPPDLSDKGRLLLPTDPKLKRKLEAVEDYIKSEDWEAVAKQVQQLLDLPTDVFIQMPVKGPDGKPVETLVGIRIAANRLVASLPEKGRAAYEKMHGEAAAELLAKARKEKDKQLFAAVAQRYLFTKAGPEATEWLATMLLDNGDFTAAAHQFDRLIQRVGLEKLEPLTLYNAARAFHKGNTKEDRENKDKVWKQLTVKAPKGLRIDGRDRTLKELEEDLKKPVKPGSTNIHDWPMFGGNPSRSGQGSGGPPFMQPLWRHPLFGSEANQVKDWITNPTGGALRKLEAKGEAIIPAAAPVTATVATFDGKQKSILVIRTYDGVHAVELKSGKVHWVSKSVWSLESMYKDPQKQQAVQQWVGMFKDQFQKPGVLIENSTIGTMSADGGRVYYIDDLAVPPYSQQYDPRFGGFPPPGTGPGFTAVVNAGVEANTLHAANIADGKLLWVLGGPRSGDEAQSKNDFRNTHFLGAPLCLGGKLYFLNDCTFRENT